MQPAEAAGTLSAYVNKIMKKQDRAVNNIIVQMLEAQGYDAEMTCVKRNGVKRRYVMSKYDTYGNIYRIIENSVFQI